MFIRRRIIGSRVYFEVVESVKSKGRPIAKTIVSLCHEKSLKVAYEKELSNLKKTQDKIARLERAIAVMGIDACYEEPATRLTKAIAQPVWTKLNRAVEDFCVAIYASKSAEEKAEIGQEFAELLGANGFYEYCRTVKENEGEDGNTTLPE